MNLHTFFQPKSIAIVGVSHNPRKVGYLVAKSMLDQGYAGKLYFVNPSGEEILGKKTFTSIHEIKKPIDLVVLAIPADASLAYFEHIHAVGCKNVVLFAAGFKEVGDEEGKKREYMLIEKAEKYGITLLGPNCIGFINTQDKINATFLKYPSPIGNIGFISQSGALGSVMVDQFAARSHLGFSYFISMGNKTNIDESDALQFLSETKNTEVIGMYLEDVKNGDKFRETLSRVTREKPVVILKSGRTQEGSQAAISHTGGLIGNDDMYDAIFSQCGAIRAENMEEFMILLKLFSFKRTPSSKDTLVLSNAGGVGVLLADELITQDLSLVTVSEKTKNKLSKAFEDLKKITVHNPIDLLGDASAYDYKQAISSTLHEKEIGSVIILLTPQANTEIMQTAEVIVAAQKSFKKPIYPVFMGRKSIEDIHEYFEKQGMASFDSYDDLPQALNKIRIYKRFLKQSQKQHSEHELTFLAHELDIKTTLLSNHGKEFLNQYDSMQVLKYSGIPVVETFLAHSEEDLQRIIKETGFPVVAKIASDKITHKTEVKGVISNIKTYDELENVFSHFTQTISTKDQGCYIQEMLKGHELFVGGKQDPHFGAVVIVGLGGIYAELMKEIAYFVYPFTQEHFITVLQNTKMKKLFEGFRNTDKVNEKKLYEIAMKIGALLHHVKDIKEVDINPLFADGENLKVADARVIIG